jgi:hypothetical protein
LSRRPDRLRGGDRKGVFGASPAAGIPDAGRTGDPQVS